MTRKVAVLLNFLFFLGAFSFSPADQDVDGQPATGQNVSYTGHQVLEIYPDNLTKIEHFLNFGRKENLDIWKHPSHVNDSIHILLSPEKLKLMKIELDKMKTRFNVLIPDVERLMETERDEIHRRHRRSSNHFNLYSYQSTNQIYTFLDSVCSETKAFCNIFSIGRSSEGREIKMLRLSAPKNRHQRLIILIDAGMHGREWISISVILHFIYELAINPTHSRENKMLLNHFDWFFIPILNPDGYEYTRHHDRLWRKTRSRSSNFFNCIGVDINRNFPNHWNEVGSSEDPCSVEYSGITALSEPESMALSNVMRMNQGNIVSYISLHAYGQLWMYPWGYTLKPPSDLTDLYRLASRATSAIRNHSGRQYVVGPSSQVLYIASGASDDYAKADLRIKYAYTVELPDEGIFGFLLPSRLIPKTCQETFAGLKAFARGLAKKTKRERNRRAKRHKKRHRRRS